MISIGVEVHVEEGGLVREGLGITDLNGEISLAELLFFTKQSLIVVADQVLAEEQAAGFDKTPVVLVDGKQGKSLFDVNPLGQIDFVSRASMSDILQFTYQTLLEKSPIWTGRYKASHYVFWNGNQVATDQASLEAWLKTNPEFGDKDLIRFVDIQPYARKLERMGITEGKQKTRTTKSRDKRKAARGVRVLQPNGVYYLTSRAVRNKYKQNSIIQFDFITGSSLGITGSFASSQGKKSRTYLYPSITISVQETGVV